MADTLLFRGGSTADVNSGATSVSAREIVIDTDTDQIVSGPSKHRTVMADGTTGDVNTTGSITVGSPDFANPSHGILIDKTDAVTSAGVLVFNQTSDSNFASCFAAYGVGTNNRVADIRNDGSASFSGQINGTTVGTSDSRFKENIEPAHPQLGDVEALGAILKNFDWNEDAPVNEEIRAQRQLGLIAQEAEEVCPSLVKTIMIQGDSYKGISHDALIMKLLGAVAELSAKVKALES